LIEYSAFFIRTNGSRKEDDMRIGLSFRISAVACALVLSTLLLPLRAECQTVPPPTPEEMTGLCDQISKRLNGDGNQPGLIKQSQRLKEQSDHLKDDLTAEEETIRVFSAYAQHAMLGLPMKTGASREYPVIDPKKALQLLIGLMQVMKETQDEIKKVSDNQKQIGNQVLLLQTFFSEPCATASAKQQASADPPAPPPWVGGTLNNTIGPLPPGFVTNSTLGSPVMPVKPSPAPTPKNPTPASLLGNWTLSTAGGCEFQGGFKPGVTHKPDGAMHFVQTGTIDPATKQPAISTIVGGQIDSVVDSWTVSANQVTIIIHPTSYFDDPVTNPPKDKFVGGWASRLQLTGTFSADGSISGNIFHDSSKPECSFKMSH